VSPLVPPPPLLVAVEPLVVADVVPPLAPLAEVAVPGPLPPLLALLAFASPPTPLVAGTQVPPSKLDPGPHCGTQRSSLRTVPGPHARFPVEHPIESGNANEAKERARQLRRITLDDRRFFLVSNIEDGRATTKAATSVTRSQTERSQRTLDEEQRAAANRCPSE